MKQSPKIFTFQFCYNIVVLVAILVIWLGWIILNANAQEWDWSPPAKHHESICSVRALSETEAGKTSWLKGSGVFIQYGELRGVLTVAHAMTGKKVIVEFSNGTKSVADDYTTDKYGHDLAFVFLIMPGSVEPARIAQISPKPGSRVEMVTTGGPETRLRSFWATVKTVGDNITEFDCDVLSGDSGGGIFTAQNEIMGIQSYGVDKIAAGERWFAARGAGSASCDRIRGFLDRIVKARAGKCGPQGCPAPLYPPRAAAGAAARSNPSPRQLVPVKPFPPRTPAPVTIDYTKLANMVLLKIDMKKLRGPAGPRGRPGETGQPGQQGPAQPQAIQDLDAIAKAIKKKISGSIRIKVTPIKEHK